MELNVSIDLQTDVARRDALISSLGSACAKLLELRFPYLVDTHTLSGRERALALKNGRTFAELVLEDGACADAMLLGGIAQSRQLQDESELFIQRATALCESMHVLLTLLEQFCVERPGANEVINLMEIACQDDEAEPTFFVELQFADGVTTGCFSKSLSSGIFPAVSRWLFKLQEQICKAFEIGAVDDNSHFLSSMRSELALLISDHVSLNGFFDSNLVKRGHNLSSDNLSALHRRIFTKEEKAACESIRENMIQDLDCVGSFCKDGSRAVQGAFEVALKFGDRVKRVCAEPPRVLLDQPGFECVLIADLPALVDETHLGFEHFKSRFSDWRFKTTRAKLATLQDCLINSIKIIRTQSLGFLPTLGNCRPPDPPWTDPRDTASAYIKALETVPRRAAGAKSSLYAPMRADVHVAMRLLSFVWECIGNSDLSAVLFTPGRVLCNLLARVVKTEQMNLNRALLTLRTCAQQCQIGQNYRNAACLLDDFRKSPKYEIKLREIARLLSPFSLNDIMTVAHEASPLFLINEFRVIDKTLSAMQTPQSCAELARQALHYLSPIMRDLRCEAMLCPGVSSSLLIDGLVSIPAVRRWDRRGDELILTGDDLKSGLGGMRDALLKLSSMKHLVHFGKRPSREKAVYGSQRVFTLNGPDLRAVLSRTLDMPADLGSE